MAAAQRLLRCGHRRLRGRVTDWSCVLGRASILVTEWQMYLRLTRFSWSARL